VKTNSLSRPTHRSLALSMNGKVGIFVCITLLFSVAWARSQQSQAPSQTAPPVTPYLAKPLNFTSTTDNSKLMRDVLFSPLDATGVGMTVHVDPFDNEGKRKLNLLIKLEERDLTFHPGDGRTLGTLQVVLAQFDSEGKEVVGETSKVDMRLLKDTYQKIRNAGLHFGRNLVLNPNATELRVVACDERTGTFGSLSIPLAKYFPQAVR